MGKRTVSAAITCMLISLWFVTKAEHSTNQDQLKTAVVNSENGAVIADSLDVYFFTYTCDTICQYATITILDNAQIKFKLKCYNKGRHTTAEIDGTAVNRFVNFGASETDEDEQGNLYPVLEYIYNKKCWLAFRFDTKFKRLIIKEADNDMYNPYCPFGSVATLKRLNKKANR